MFELALRSTLILLAAWLTARLLARATAATRHLVWHSAVVAVLMAPVMLPIVPKFEIPRLEPLRLTLSPADPLNPLSTTPASPRNSSDIPRHVGITADTSSRSGHWSLATAITARTVGLLSILGTLSILCWFCLGWVSAARMARRSQQAPRSWQVELETLCHRLRITRIVRLGIMPGNGSPLAIGLWRSAVLLPETALAWDADRRRAVLLHELAHIRRGDCRIQALADLACAIYWFNPLVWLAAARLRSERERACDDEVLHSGAQPSVYAAQLLQIARELRRSPKPSAALAMARPSELEGRLSGILAAGRARVPARGSRWAVAATLAVATVGALGATPVTAEVSTPQPLVEANPAELFVPFREEAIIADRVEPGPLQKALEDDDSDVREKAALTLAFMSGPEVVPALLTALRDRSAQVREKAAIGLALRRDERIIQPLLAAMSDPDAQVREKIAIALGASGDPRAAAALEAALQDADAQVREKAVAGLLLLGVTRK